MQIDEQEAIRQQKVIEQVYDQWKQRFAAITTDIALRKWCLEQACKLLQERAGNPVVMAEAMHSFITSQAADLDQDASGGRGHSTGELPSSE